MRTARSLPSIGIHLGICLFFAAVAAVQFHSSLQFADLFYVNSVLQPEDLKTTDAVSVLAPLADDIISGGHCRSDILEAGLNVVLTDVDQQNASVDYDRWSTSVERADRYVRHALSCNPMDGNLWVRLAMVARASGENATELSSLVSRSADLSPSELSVMRARFVVWRKAGRETLTLSKDAVQGDVSRLLENGSVDTISEMLDGSSVFLEPYLKAALSLISNDKRDELRKLVPALKVAADPNPGKSGRWQEAKALPF